MAKFQIEWTEETWYRIKVDAASEAEALANFWAGRYSYLIDDSSIIGGETQDSVQVDKVVG